MSWLMCGGANIHGLEMRRQRCHLIFSYLLHRGQVDKRRTALCPLTGAPEARHSRGKDATKKQRASHEATFPGAFPFGQLAHIGLRLRCSIPPGSSAI